MSAYSRGDLSLEAYLVRILAALCRQNGGELRIKGELVDSINEPTTLLKDWDSHTQELVLRTHMGSFGEVFRVVPEKQPVREVIAAEPLKPNGKPTQEELFPKKTSTLDNEKLAAMEQTLQKRRIASMLRDELASRRVTERNSGG